jgi:hypothetical protein
MGRLAKLRRRHHRQGKHCTQGHKYALAVAGSDRRCKVCRIHAEVRRAAAARWLGLAAA